MQRLSNRSGGRSRSDVDAADAKPLWAFCPRAAAVARARTGALLWRRRPSPCGVAFAAVMEDELYLDNIDEFVTDQNRVVRPGRGAARRGEGVGVGACSGAAGWGDVA